MRIGICGTQCSGKTTLAKYIANCEHIPALLDLAGQFDNRHLMSTQIAIADYQMQSERGHQDGFVSDRTIFDNIAYQSYLDPQFTFCHQIYREHLQRCPYDLVVFVDEYFPIEDTGHRSINIEQQSYVYYFLKTRVPEYTRSASIPLVCVCGSTEHRYDMICDFLRTRLKYECD